MLGTLFMLLLAIQIGLLVHYNPLLFGRTVPIDEHNQADVASFHVYTDHPVLDHHLNVLRSQHISDDKDFIAYRNHCLRVLSFSVYHLGQQDAFPTVQDINVMALAVAYHDIGLWSDGGVLDYLEPSVQQLEKNAMVHTQAMDDSSSHDKKKKTKNQQPQWTERDLATAREIIRQHHKVTEWKPDGESSLVNARLVNYIRKGDWADATMGLVRFGLPATHLQVAYEKLPDAGFHQMLAGLGSRLSPASLVGRLQVLHIFKL